MCHHLKPIRTCFLRYLWPTRANPAVHFKQLQEKGLRSNSSPSLSLSWTPQLKMSGPKFLTLTQYTKVELIKILICQARGKGSTIEELCTSFGLKRRTVERVLRSKLILPAGRRPSLNKQKSILHKIDILRSNPYLSMEQLYIRYPKIFNYCCLERVWQLTRNN